MNYEYYYVLQRFDCGFVRNNKTGRENYVLSALKSYQNNKIKLIMFKELVLNPKLMASN